MKRRKLQRYAETLMYLQEQGIAKVIIVEGPVEDTKGALVKYVTAQAEIERISKLYKRRIWELQQVIISKNNKDLMERKMKEWVRRRVKEAGWEDKEVDRVIGDEGNHLITFTDAACLIRGNVVDGKWVRR